MGNDNSGGLIAAGGALLGQGINWAAQGSMNKKTRKWSEDMYARQRADSLADWSMQNAYNSPEQQMARYRAAGLNPNLIYGQQTTSPSVRSTTAPSWNPSPQRFEAGSVTGAYLDTQIRQAQIDQLAINQELARAEISLKEAQKFKIVGETETNKWTLGFKQSIADYQTEALRGKINQTYAQTKATIDENERRAAMQAPSLQLAAVKILQGRAETARTKAQESQIYAQIENIRKDGKIKDFEIDLQKSNITKGDPAWLRALESIIKGEGTLYDRISPRRFKDYINSKVSQGYHSIKKAAGW